MYHGQCDAGYRAWLADSLTWKSFCKLSINLTEEVTCTSTNCILIIVPGEVFPGKEPVGKEIHHNSCVGQPRSLAASKSGLDRRPSITNQSHGNNRLEETVIPKMNDRPTIPPQSHNTTPLKAQIPSIRAIPTWGDAGRLLVTGIGQHLIDCSEVVLRNISYNLLTDNQRRSAVGDTLDCAIICHERKRSPGPGLTIQITALAGISTSREKLINATYYIESWIRDAIKEGGLTPKLSSFCTNRLLYDRPFEGEPVYGMVDSETQTEESSPPGIEVPISLGGEYNTTVSTPRTSSCQDGNLKLDKAITIVKWLLAMYMATSGCFVLPPCSLTT
jgi:hypothetical protein